MIQRIFKEGAYAPLAPCYIAYNIPTLNTPIALGLPFVPVHGQRAADHNAGCFQACLKPSIRPLPDLGQQTPMQIRNTPDTQGLPSRRGQWHMAKNSAELIDFCQKHSNITAYIPQRGNSFCIQPWGFVPPFLSGDKYAFQTPADGIYAKR